MPWRSFYVMYTSKALCIDPSMGSHMVVFSIYLSMMMILAGLNHPWNPHENPNKHSMNSHWHPLTSHYSMAMIHEIPPIKSWNLIKFLMKSSNKSIESTRSHKKKEHRDTSKSQKIPMWHCPPTQPPQPARSARPAPQALRWLGTPGQAAAWKHVHLADIHGHTLSTMVHP